MRSLWMRMLLVGFCLCLIGVPVFAADVNINVGFTEGSDDPVGPLTDLLEHNVVVKDAAGTELGALNNIPASSPTGGQPMSVVIPVTVPDDQITPVTLEWKSVDMSGNEGTSAMVPHSIDAVGPSPPHSFTITTTVTTSISLP